ncbi:MAG: DUF882 domain-containing protein [Pseudomonadota bacterium]
MIRSFTRRHWIKSLLAGGAGLSFARLGVAQDAAVEAAKPAERSIELFNTHTHETVSVVYRRGEDYDATALASLKNLLRDHRNDESHDMDPRLYDQLHELAQSAGCRCSYEIISGYRSPESNDKMSSRPGSGVAKKSLHMEGRAIDVRLKNCSCATLRDLALAVKKGGVGYYERSDFVHLDTGSFRTWVG